MIKAGFVIENSVTKSRTTVLESDVETNGAGWLLETRCPPKSMPDIAEHFHLNWTETFEIIFGTAPINSMVLAKKHRREKQS